MEEAWRAADAAWRVAVTNAGAKGRAARLAQDVAEQAWREAEQAWVKAQQAWGAWQDQL